MMTDDRDDVSNSLNLAEQKFLINHEISVLFSIVTIELLFVDFIEIQNAFRTGNCGTSFWTI